MQNRICLDQTQNDFLVPVFHQAGKGFHVRGPEVVPGIWVWEGSPGQREGLERNVGISASPSRGGWGGWMPFTLDLTPIIHLPFIPSGSL